MRAGQIQQQGGPRMLYDSPSNEFVRDFIGKTLLFRGRVQMGNPSGKLGIALDGAPECVVFGQCFQPGGLATGTEVFIGVRPEDVDILPATAGSVPAGMIGGSVRAALFVGERVEYQVEVDGQREMLIYGDRHDPLDKGSKVWLKLRPDGHSAWPSDTSGAGDEEVSNA
jgi:ABC-type Fe3+/spermidine/putrescine transport system ATPase subunit